MNINIERENVCEDVKQPKPLLVMKFGGTSVGGARPIKAVVNLVDRYKREDNALVVVVSAIRGATNNLVEMGNLIEANNRSGLELALEDFWYRHYEVASGLDLNHPLRISLEHKIEELFFDLYDFALSLNELTLKHMDRILSYGERLNAPIVQAALVSKGILSEVVEATEIIETDNNFSAASPNMERTTQHARNILLPKIGEGIIPVVTGFIGSTMYGEITTLDRGGSDYTASILGNALKADEVWIWTDVDGVYTADPRKDPNARLLLELSQIKAHQMAMQGARVLYTKTVAPLLGSGIVLRVKNTFNPDAIGTKIYRKLSDENRNQ